MIEIKQLTIDTVKGHSLVENLNLIINPKDKIAVIGEEGNGKTTLLKSIYDLELVKEYCNVKGIINKNNKIIGYLEQNLNPNWNDFTVCDFFLKNSPLEETLYERYNELGEIEKTMSRLNVNSEMLYSDQLIKTLSGGEKVKIQLAKLIYMKPDVLLLDEPTNDLDIETLEWLEDFIKTSDIPIMYISHDETLLENTATSILHLEQISKKTKSRWTHFPIGYKEYVEKRQRSLEKQERLSVMEKKEWIESFKNMNDQKNAVRSALNATKDAGAGAKLAKKMRNVKSQERKLENKELIDKPDVEESINVFFGENTSIPKGKIVIDFFLSELEIKERLLAKNIELKVIGNSHIVIIGKNGCGKTTLFKKIYSELNSRNDIRLGYMPQNYEDNMNLEMQVIEFLKTEDITETIIRAYLGNLKFTREEMTNTIENLSGGQRAKLQILRMVLNKCNVLLLDEPTRNLSPLSNPVIRNMLKEYSGAIISISHDRKFIDEVCDTVYEMSESGLVLKRSL